MFGKVQNRICSRMHPQKIVEHSALAEQDGFDYIHIGKPLNP